MDMPEVEYARSGGVAIAYQVVGDGPQTLVYVPPVTNLYSLWEQPRAESFLRRLSEEMRVAVLNPRGAGLSDRPPRMTLESRTDDLNAVLDTIGCEQATVFGADVSANVCALFAATYPERCDRLALFMPHARVVRTDSHPYGPTEEQALEGIREWRRSWGDREFLESFARAIFDSELVEEEGFLDWFVRERRLAASPASAADFARMAVETDITSVLGSIRVPTLVLHRDQGGEQARYVADRIPHATIVELAGRGAGCTPTMSPMPCSRSCAATRCLGCRIRCSRPCSSPISWARPSGRRSSEIAGGAPCSSVTTPLSGPSSGDIGVPRSTVRATVLLPIRWPGPGDRLRAQDRGRRKRARYRGACGHPHR